MRSAYRFIPLVLVGSPLSDELRATIRKLCILPEILGRRPRHGVRPVSRCRVPRRLELAPALVTSLALALVAGCGGDGGNGPGTSPTVDDAVPFGPQRGVVRTESELAWLRGDSTLAFTVGAEAPALWVFEAANGTERVIDARPLYRTGIGAGNADRWICVVTWARLPEVTGTHECVDINDGSIVMLAENAASGTLGWSGGHVGTADSLIAYAVRGPECVTGLGGSTCDSLFLFNARTSSRQLLGSGIPIVFAPDGKRLLYFKRPCEELSGNTNSCELYTRDLVNGSESAVWNGPTTDIPFATRWTAAGIRRLVLAKGGRDTLALRDLSRGATRTIYVLSSSTREEIWYPAVSADGKWAAYWLWSFADGLHLVVVDLETGSSRELMHVSGGSDDTGPIALSATGGRIAYGFQSQGYWLELR